MGTGYVKDKDGTIYPESPSFQALIDAGVLTPCDPPPVSKYKRVFKGPLELREAALSVGLPLPETMPFMQAQTVYHRFVDALEASEIKVAPGEEASLGDFGPTPEELAA